MLGQRNVQQHELQEGPALPQATAEHCPASEGEHRTAGQRVRQLGGLPEGHSQPQAQPDAGPEGAECHHGDACPQQPGPGAQEPGEPHTGTAVLPAAAEAG